MSLPVVSPLASELRPVLKITGEDLSLTHQALLAVKKGNWNSAERQFARTRNPLAAKMYYWLKYTKGQGDISFIRLTHFIRANPDWPSQATMQRRAESIMPDDLRDDEVIAWFSDYAPRTPEGMERYLASLSRTGNREELGKTLRAWWRTALLSPAQQQQILSQYGSLLDDSAHRARFDKLMFAKHYTNARSLAMLLGNGYPELADARIALAEDKAGLDHVIARVPSYLKDDPGLDFERLSWRRRHNYDYRAMEILHKSPPADKIANPEDWWKERHIIARRLIEQKKYKSAYLLVSQHKQTDGLAFAQAEFLAGFLALSFLEEPAKAYEHFEALYHKTATPISRSRGAYWAGRAMEALQSPDMARSWYEKAAEYPTAYYGQMAMAKLGADYTSPAHAPPVATVEGQMAFKNREMVQVARLFHNAGLWKESTEFLYALSRQINEPEDYLYVADLARDLEHYHNAIHIAKTGLNKNIFLMDHAYPTMVSRMRNIEAEWALVHALIRQESAFDYQAESPAGARGLMQVMPATAAGVAKKHGIRHATEWLTTNPEHNIRIGSYYIQEMLDRYDGSYPLAVAAYNAGPGRVDKWLKTIGDPRKGEIDVVTWVELIPIYETRNYVQRVLENTYVYRLKLKDVQKSANSPIHVAMSAR
ncbi:MAG: transglycosylase SLT domain-containing protein [Rhodospirillales bacterium]|nr:transglycosylase SLT domain-containing protein [Rhodospirillales bacterium]